MAEQNKLALGSAPEEILAKVIRANPKITVAELHKAVKETTGIESAEERTKIIEKAQELAKAPAPAVVTPTPTPPGPLQPEPQKPEVVQKPVAIVLAPHQQAAQERALGFINTQLWNAMGLMAKTFTESQALPASIRNAPQLMMVFQAGYEAGMQPIASINSFYFVNGKLAMYGDQMISQVIRAGHRVEFTKSDAKSCTCKITRGDNGQAMEETVAITDIPKRLLAKAGPWQEYPKRMLKYKAFAEVAHFLVPEALGGVAIAEDIAPELEDAKDPASRPPKVAKHNTTPRPHRPLQEALAGEQE